MIYIAQSLIAHDHRACVLKWGASSDDDLVGYNVYMAFENKPEAYNKVNTQLLIDSEYVVGENLRNDQLYYFFVTAVDETGNESEASNIITFKLKDYRKETVIVVITRDVTVAASSDYTETVVTKDFLTKYTLGG